MSDADAKDDPANGPETDLGALLAGLMDTEPENVASHVPSLRTALSSNRLDLRILATVLASRAGEAGLPILQEALRSDQPALRQIAAQGLTRLKRHPAAIDALVEAAKDADANTAEIACMALESAGKAALDPLRLLIHEGKPATSIRALRALGQVAKGMGLPLLELDAARKDDDPQKAIAAAEASVQSSGDPGKGLVDLIMQLENSDPSVRESAAEACGRLMDLAKPAAPQLQRLLTADEAAAVRAAAAQAVALIGGHVANTVPTLTDALRDRDHDVRRSVIIALAALEDLAMPAMPALEALRRTVEDEGDLALITAALARVSGERG